MVGQKIQHPPTRRARPPPLEAVCDCLTAERLTWTRFRSVADKAAFYWNPHGGPKFYEHLVYGAGKPRCVVPLEAFKKACKEVNAFRGPHATRRPPLNNT